MHPRGSGTEDWHFEAEVGEDHLEEVGSAMIFQALRARDSGSTAVLSLCSLHLPMKRFVRAT